LHHTFANELFSSVFDWPPTSCPPSATIAAAGTPVAAPASVETVKLNNELDSSAVGSSVAAPASAETDEPDDERISSFPPFSPLFSELSPSTSIYPFSLVFSTCAMDMVFMFNPNSMAIRQRTCKFFDYLGLLNAEMGRVAPHLARFLRPRQEREHHSLRRAPSTPLFCASYDIIIR